jgi:CMP-N-acetylneuraminic acid synthetase
MIIIPAKYGSSRAPQKNFRSFFCNLSLLQIAVIRCVEANCGPVLVSSENAQIVKSQLDALPLRIKNSVSIHARPGYLAKDPSTILDVVANCIQEFDIDALNVAVVLPTSPFNSITCIKDAWRIFATSKAHKLLSVSRTSKPPFNAWVDAISGEDGELSLAFPESPYCLTQSTACPETFMSNGCISIYSRHLIDSRPSLVPTLGFKMPQIASLDIDYEHEFELARLAFPIWGKDLKTLEAQL